MARNVYRIVLVLLLLLPGIFLPVVFAGYAELEHASSAGTYPEAAAHYQRAARFLLWRPDLYEIAGHAHYHAGQYAQADRAYQAAYQRHALSPEGWVAWGDVHYLLDDTRRAAEIWEQALGEPGASAYLYSRLAELYQSGQDPARAAEFLGSYVDAHPGDASGHYRLGLLLALPEPDRALAELLEAARLDPDFDPAVQTLRTALNLAALEDSPSARSVITGRGLGLVGEWRLARLAFEEGVRLDGTNAEAQAWLGEAIQQTGGEGSEQLEQAFRLDPGSATVRGLRGLSFQRTGNFRAALADFQAAAALEPGNAAWFISLGEAHAGLGDLIRALEAYQRATVLAPEDPAYWRLLAIFCAQHNIHIRDIGVPAAQKAVVLAGEDAVSLDVLGWLLLLDRRFEEADRVLHRALELDPHNSSAHLHLGMLSIETGDRPSAYDHLLQARDLGNSEAQGILSLYFP